MNPNYEITIVVASIIYWIFLIVGVIIVIVSLLKENRDEKRSDKETKRENVYWCLCIFFDLLGGYIVFVLLGVVIALFIKNIVIQIIVFIPIWYASLQFAHRVMPRVVNRALGKIMGIDKEISG